jgi:cell wall-associated NlpC family hydrolase
VQDGVLELFDRYYTSPTPVPHRGRLSLAGLDCSGLLYQATGGWTPRNTSQLLAYGTGVNVAGKSAAELAALLEPLDLVVWNGHVLIVLDRETIIESRLECGNKGNGGVVMTPLQRRLTEIMRTRRPVNSWPVAGKQKDVFVVRRWYGL